MEKMREQINVLGQNMTLVGFPDPSDLNSLLDSTTYSFLLGVAFYKDENGRRGAPGIDTSSKKVA